MRMHTVWIESLLTLKCKCHKSEHIKRRHCRSKYAKQPKYPGPLFAAKRLPEYFIFAKKSGKRRYASNCNRSNKKCFIGDRQIFFESAHFLNILLIVHCMDDGTGTKEEERFEKSVRQQMKDACTECRHTHSKKHIPKLADCGICENFLDIVLY